MLGKSTSKDFVPAGIPANIFNLVRALEQFTLKDKISFYVKTADEMRQCASYFFERAVMNSDPKKFADCALKMLKFYPNEDTEPLTFKNALLGELKVKCYDAIYESDVTTERAVGIVKFFGELYNVGLIISGILKKQIDVLNERKFNCAKSRKCLLTLISTVKDKVRILLETDQSIVVKKTIEIIEEVEQNPTIYQEPQPCAIKKVKCQVKPIVQQPQSEQEKREAYKILITEVTSDNSTEIIKKIKDNHTFLLSEDIWKLFCEELILKSFDTPEVSGSVIDICLKAIAGTSIKKEDCKKIFYDIIKRSISNSLIDESPDHLEGVIIFIDKMIDRKNVSISNIREIIETIITFQGENANLAAQYFINLFDVIKSSKKIKQSKVQELDEPVRRNVIEIVKRSSIGSSHMESSVLDEYLFGAVLPETPVVVKQMSSSVTKSENKEFISSASKKVRSKKKTFVDFNEFNGENGFSNACLESQLPLETSWLENKNSRSYDVDLKINSKAPDGETLRTEKEFNNKLKKQISLTNIDTDDYEEYLRKEFPDLNHSLPMKSTAVDLISSSSTHNRSDKLFEDFFKNVNTQPESSSLFEVSHALKSSNTFDNFDLPVFHEPVFSSLPRWNIEDDLYSFTRNLSGVKSSTTNESSKLMDLFNISATRLSPNFENGTSSSSSTRDSPVSSTSDANKFIVQSFDFSGFIDNLVNSESTNIKELVQEASKKREWEWKKFAEELLIKSLNKKDLDTYIDIGMMIANDSQHFKKILGNTALSALGNELGKEIGLDFFNENESNETATRTANFISLLYVRGCLNDSNLYQCMSLIATGNFGNIRRVKIFIALLRPAGNKVKKDIRKDVMTDYLRTVRLASIEPMKSQDQWIYTELIDLLKSLIATDDEDRRFLNQPDLTQPPPFIDPRARYLQTNNFSRGSIMPLFFDHPNNR